MNLMTGEIVEILVEDGVPTARISIGGAYTRASLAVLRHAKVGDTVLVEAGVAIATVTTDHAKENPHVSGHSR